MLVTVLTFPAAFLPNVRLSMLLAVVSFSLVLIIFFVHLFINFVFSTLVKSAPMTDWLKLSTRDV